MREWDSYRSAVVNEKEIGQTRFPDRIRRLIVRSSDNGVVCHARISVIVKMPKRRILEYYSVVEFVKQLKRKEEKETK